MKRINKEPDKSFSCNVIGFIAVLDMAFPDIILDFIIPGFFVASLSHALLEKHLLSRHDFW